MLYKFYWIDSPGMEADRHTSPLTTRFRDLGLGDVVPMRSIPTTPEQFALAYDRDGLALLAPGFARPFRLTAELVEARLKTKSPGQSLLARACGAVASHRNVFDPFAGFGLDGLALALRGCAVTLVELHPLVWLMLDEFAARLAATTPHLGAVEVVHGDGVMALQRHSGFDVVYLDPLFPARRKQALPNRGMQHLQALASSHAAGTPPELEELIAKALRVAPRVVLKRRRRDALTLTPSFQISGRTIRFDVYQDDRRDQEALLADKTP